MYELRILPPAARYLKKLKNKALKCAFQSAIDELMINPYIGDPKIGDLSGIYSIDIYFNKNNYELAYAVTEVNDKKLIIIMAGTRQNFYQDLKRYMRNEM